VYADESCLGNGRAGDNPGGAGGLVEYRNARTGAMVRRDYWMSEAATTNNRMALRSVIEVIRGLSAKGSRLSIVFTSDSRYLIDGLGSWVYSWAARGWTRKGGPIENLSLWRETIAELRAGGHEYDWRWVRGHAGHPQNEYANHLATRAAEAQDSSGGLVPSTFETWLADLADGKRRSALGTPNPFPDLSSFTAAPPLPDPGATLPRSTAGRREWTRR
jgi:ribonuclease HI